MMTSPTPPDLPLRRTHPPTTEGDVAAPPVAPIEPTVSLEPPLAADPPLVVHEASFEVPVSPVAAVSPASAEAEAVLSEGTFTRIKEPRNTNRLPLGDGTWHQIAPQYVWGQAIGNGFLLLLALAAGLVVSLVFHQYWVWIPVGVVALLLIWALAILPRQARAYGYQLRSDDLVFRRGILWQRMVAVPYGRMQLVDITHGPLDRMLGIAQLKLVTAAATTGVTIPGLKQAAAETLRDTLVDVAETRRTGL